MFKIIISGRITKDPEIKKVGDDKVCNFTIAATNTDKADTSYLRCSCWNGLASAVEKHVKKGKQLFILGSGQIKKYKGKDDGIERDVLNIRCDVVEFGADSKSTVNIHDEDEMFITPDDIM